MDFLFITAVSILVSLIIIWIRFRRQRFSIFKRNGITGPEPNLWFGNFKEFVNKKEDLITEYVEKYGKVFGFFLGAKPILIVTDEEFAKFIQVKNFSNFANRDLGLPDFGIPQPEILSALPAAHDQEWKKKRNLVSPSFSASKLKRLLPIMKASFKIFMGVIEESRNDEYIDVVDVMKNLTLDIITKITLGIDTGVQLKQNGIFLNSARLFFSKDNSDFLPALSLCFPELEPLPTKLRNIIDTLKHVLGLPSIRTVLTHIQEIIDNRRAHSERRDDMLQGLMEEKINAKKVLSMNYEELDKDGGIQHGLDVDSKENVSLSDDDIKGTMSIMLAAGFDTTSITLSYLLYYLAKYQDVQEKVRKEIDTKLAGKKDIEYEDLPGFPYMEQVIFETLRLHPTNLITVSRIVKESFEYNGFTVPKGITISIPSNHLHKNPSEWPDPKTFQPDRFSLENKAHINWFMYQPYGMGPRKCVGLRYAHVLIRLLLVLIIRSYKVKNFDNKEFETDYAVFITQPKNIRIKFEPVSHLENAD